MIKLTCLLVIFSVFVTRCTGQWPLGPEFYNSMNRMVNNLNKMQVNLQTIGTRVRRELQANMARLRRELQANMAEVMMRAREGITYGNGGVMIVTSGGGLGNARIAEDMRRAKKGIPFGNGGVVFVTAEGGLGYAYNSTDGSYTLYSLGNGSPPRGYMYHVGPSRTSYRSW